MYLLIQLIQVALQNHGLEHFGYFQDIFLGCAETRNFLAVSKQSVDVAISGDMAVVTGLVSRSLGLRCLTVRFQDLGNGTECAEAFLFYPYHCVKHL